MGIGSDYGTKLSLFFGIKLCSENCKFNSNIYRILKYLLRYARIAFEIATIIMKQYFIVSILSKAANFKNVVLL